MDDLDREVAWLARRIGMSDLARHDVGPPLSRLPDPLSIQIDGRSISGSMFASRRQLRGGLIAGQDRRGETLVDFVVESPAEVRTWRHPRGSALAMPHGAWSIGGDEFPGRVEVVGALEQANVRAAALHDLEGTGAVGIATFDGTRWTAQFAPNTRLSDSVQDPRTGAIDLLERGVGETLLRRVEVILGRVDSTRVRAPNELKYALCTDAGRTWYLTEGGLFRFDGGSGQHIPAGHDAHTALVDCQKETALLLWSHPERLERCRDGACTTVLTTGRHRGAAALLEEGSWIYAAVLGDVVGVWREGGVAPVFYRLQQGGTLVTVAGLRGKPWLVMKDGAGAFRFVPLP